MFYKWFREENKNSKGIILKIKVTENSKLLQTFLNSKKNKTHTVKLFHAVISKSVKT